MKIAEPRARRVIYFVIYIGLGISGSAAVLKPSPNIEVLLGGLSLIYLFGGLIVAGALICVCSVLPGIWMFERAGLVGLGTGVAMYTGTLVGLGASALITIIPVILILMFVLRWMEIKEYLLAPRKG
jgi:hypothetical protein